MEKHEYKKGDLVRLVKPDQVDRIDRLQIGDLFELEDIEDGLAYCKYMKSGIIYRFALYQIEPANIESVTKHPTEREKAIRQMAHEYVVAYLHTPVVDNIHVQEFIKIATELYDTPIPPPSKP